MSKNNILFIVTTLIIAALIALMFVTKTGQRHVTPGTPAASQTHI